MCDVISHNQPTASISIPDSLCIQRRGTCSVACQYTGYVWASFTKASQRSALRHGAVGVPRYRHGDGAVPRYRSTTPETIQHRGTAVPTRGQRSTEVPRYRHGAIQYHGTPEYRPGTWEYSGVQNSVLTWTSDCRNLTSRWNPVPVTSTGTTSAVNRWVRASTTWSGCGNWYRAPWWREREGGVRSGQLVQSPLVESEEGVRSGKLVQHPLVEGE